MQISFFFECDSSLVLKRQTKIAADKILFFYFYLSKENKA